VEKKKIISGESHSKQIEERKEHGGAEWEIVFCSGSQKTTITTETASKKPKKKRLTKQKKN